MTWPLEHELPPVEELAPTLRGVEYKWLTLLAAVAGYQAFGGPDPPEHVKLWAWRLTRKASFASAHKRRRRIWLWVHWLEPWLPPEIPWWPR